MTRKILVAVFVAAVGIAAPVLSAGVDCCVSGAACCIGGGCCQK
jgi:hypothetical protein